MKTVSQSLGALACFCMLGACGGTPDAELPIEAGAQASLQSTHEELRSNALTTQQANLVLKLVDDICGDTWCEGDHNFRFQRIHCKTGCSVKPGSCTLAFSLFPHDSSFDIGPTYHRTCKTRGFSGFSSLVDTSANGYQSLNWNYYEAISECINQHESNLPRL
jgi:hypothetical protein